MYGVLAAFLEKEPDSWQVPSRAGVKQPGRLPTDWAQPRSRPQWDTMGHPAWVLPQHMGLLQEAQGRESGGLVCVQLSWVSCFPSVTVYRAEISLLPFWMEYWLLWTLQARDHDPAVSLPKAKMHEQKKETALEIRRRTCHSCPTTDGFFFLGPTGLLHLYLARVQNLHRSLYCIQSRGSLLSSKNASQFLPSGGFSMGPWSCLNFWDFSRLEYFKARNYILSSLPPTANPGIEYAHRASLSNKLTGNKTHNWYWLSLKLEFLLLLLMEG